MHIVLGHLGDYTVTRRLVVGLIAMCAACAIAAIYAPFLRPPVVGATDQCSDGIDNDGDGLIDYPTDPGCVDYWDPSELDSVDPPSVACNDGFDNDSDTFIDLADAGCDSALDISEVDDVPVVLAQCSDSIDNDGDTLIDMLDPGCESVSGDERSTLQCDDGLDNDLNGLIDMLDLDHCTSPNDVTEADPTPPTGYCGDFIVQDGTGGTADLGEQCDPDPPSTGACAYGQTSCFVCGTTPAITSVVLSNTAPVGDRWNYAAVEILPDANATIRLDGQWYTDSVVAGTTDVTLGWTPASGNLLVAFVTCDEDSSAGEENVTSIASVAPSLTWTSRAVSGVQKGVAEIWTAQLASSARPTADTVVTVTSARTEECSVYVAAFADAHPTAPIGTIAVGNAAIGLPSLQVTSLSPGSWVWGVGFDWTATADAVATSPQVIVHSRFRPLYGNSWVQTLPTPNSFGDGCQTIAGSTSYCGDQIVDSGNSEECDNDAGNPPASGDGCSATCVVEVPDPPTEAWIGAWGFEEAPTSPTVTDSSSSGYDGTLVASAIRGSGHTSLGLETNGVAGHVSLGTIDPFTAAGTIMAWIKADDYGTADARIISKSTSSAEQGHYWMLSTVSSSGSKLRMRLKTGTDAGAGTTTLIATSGTMVAGTWYHVAGTYDGSVMALYVDGVSVVTPVAKTGDVMDSPGTYAWIGANPGAASQVFDGVIDDVKFFPTALTASEIQAEMLVAVASPEPILTQCNDNIDNDGGETGADGLKDWDGDGGSPDTDCLNAADNDESMICGDSSLHTTGALEACDDGNTVVATCAYGDVP